MSDDAFEYVAKLSGEAGDLKAGMIACGDVNNTMTRLFDAWFGPDEVDSFDASCNTCKHFRRKPMTTEEKSKRNIFGMPGDCQKKNVAVTGWQRGQYCGFENADCYENRRTNMKPNEACKPKEEMTT